MEEENNRDEVMKFNENRIIFHHHFYMHIYIASRLFQYHKYSDIMSDKIQNTISNTIKTFLIKYVHLFIGCVN